jgi:hypothetical protein
MELHITLWRIPIELHRNSMELHVPIFYEKILWRFLWIFPLGITNGVTEISFKNTFDALILCYKYTVTFASFLSSKNILINVKVKIH